METPQETSLNTNNPNSLINTLIENKKILIIVGVVLFLFVSFLVIIFSFVWSNTDHYRMAEELNDKSTPTSSLGSKGQAKTVSEPTIEPIVLAEEVAIDFYNWYSNHAAPLSSGAYKTRSDITDEYKMIMGGYVKRGLSTTRDDIFNCGNTTLPNNLTSLKAEEDLYQGLALVILQEKNSKRDLFQIKLQKFGNTWKVRDVWCAP